MDKMKNVAEKFLRYGFRVRQTPMRASRLRIVLMLSSETVADSSVIVRHNTLGL